MNGDDGRTCLLCGFTSRSDVRVSMVRWRRPIDGARFSSLPRCLDRVACRARCEKAGLEWEVADTAAELPPEPSKDSEPKEVSAR